MGNCNECMRNSDDKREEIYSVRDQNVKVDREDPKVARSGIKFNLNEDDEEIEIKDHQKKVEGNETLYNTNATDHHDIANTNYQTVPQNNEGPVQFENEILISGEDDVVIVKGNKKIASTTMRSGKHEGFDQVKTIVKPVQQTTQVLQTSQISTTITKKERVIQNSKFLIKSTMKISILNHMLKL